MASPASNGADDSIVIANSQVLGDDIEDDCDSTPPLSPELGMGSPSRSEVDELELEGGAKQHLTDAHLDSVERQNDDLASESESEGLVHEWPRRHQTQQLRPQSAQRSSPESGCTQLIMPVPTCPPTRRSARAKSTLMYDQKYHPMDDIVRPSQAAKRRSLHGEQPRLWSGSDGEVSQELHSDVESVAGDEYSHDKESQQPMQGRKRKRSRSRHPEPTRRLSRRRTNPKVSYNMKIHPQDSDLERIWAWDESKIPSSPTEQVVEHPMPQDPEELFNSPFMLDYNI